MPAVGLRLPLWTRHPVFGVALLLVLAIALIAHGEPQPSSRPSGRSVVVTSAPPSGNPLPATLLISGGAVERHAGSQTRRVALPVGVRPLSVITAHGYSVVLGLRNGRQHAYGVTAALKVTDLGLADNVVPAAVAPAVIVIERAVLNPGLPPGSQPSPTPLPSSVPKVAESRGGPTPPGTASPTATSSSTAGSPAPSRDYSARRYDALGRPVGATVDLPDGQRIATDSAVGLFTWQPVNLVVDRGLVTASLSASATLVRPDGSFRVIGAFHPLAATAQDLLVWDVARGAFGLLPLTDATATSTRTRTLTASAGATASASGTASVSGTASARGRPGRAGASPSTAPRSTARPGSDLSPASPTDGSGAISPVASASPSTVAGARFFQPTRGFLVIGPASFSPDGKSFAAYAQVGSRRRLVIGDVSDVGTDQIEVLALSQAETEQRPAGGASTGGVSGVSVSGTVTAADGNPSTTPPSSGTGSATGSASSKRPSPSPSTTGPTLEPGGFPVPAPAVPVWLSALVVGVAADGSVVGYVPGGAYASVLDLGAADGVLSLADAP